MNVIAFIILLAILAEAVLHTLADVLNLKTLQEDLLPAFQDVYDKERYTKSQQYLRTNTRFLTGLIFLGVLAGFKALSSLPFRMYGTFVIEERFGFNKTTWRIFLLDLLKGTLLGIVLGLPIVTGVLVFFSSSARMHGSIAGSV